MCSPSRVSMLTGWRPERTGVWTNVDPPRPEGAVPLHEHFAAHGAVTAAVGKVLHFPENFRWDVREEHPDVVEEEHEGRAIGTAGEGLVGESRGDGPRPARRPPGAARGSSPRALPATLLLPRRGLRAPAPALDRAGALLRPVSAGGDGPAAVPGGRPRRRAGDRGQDEASAPSRPAAARPRAARSRPGPRLAATGDGGVPGLRVLCRRAGGGAPRRARPPRPLEGHRGRARRGQRLPPRRARRPAAQGHALRGGPAGAAGRGCPGARAGRRGRARAGRGPRRVPDRRRAGRPAARPGPRRPQPRAGARESRRGRPRGGRLLPAGPAPRARVLAADGHDALHPVARRQRGALRPPVAGRRKREPRRPARPRGREGAPARAPRGARRGDERAPGP